MPRGQVARHGRREHAAPARAPARGACSWRNGITDFVREFPLAWNGHVYRYDFAFPATHTILETNGRRWHDDPTDYERDHQKWSVPGRHGYRIVFATWDVVTERPDELVRDLTATMAA